MMKDRWAFLSLLAAAVWIGVTTVFFKLPPTPGIAAPQKGFAAPDFSLPDATGQVLTLSALRGHAVLVNLWASWCPPCRAEMPAIQKVYETYREQGLIVLAVNVTSQDDPQKALDFAARNGLTFPILLDLNSEVGKLYASAALPTSYFIDPQGIIREVVIGGPMSEALLQVRVAELFEGER